MGAWGFGPFDNDDAADWVYELEGSDSDDVLQRALAATSGSGYLDSQEGTTAVAAAEVVAASLGQPAPDLPDGVRAWVATNGGAVRPELAAAARSAIGRVRGEESELRELWAESDDGAAWEARLRDLESRLG